MYIWNFVTNNSLQFIWLRSVANLKADAQNSYLGIAWWLLEPLLLTGLIYLAFASGLRGGGGKEFVLFLLCGMLPIKWTIASISSGGNALNINKGIIGQSYYPKWIFPTIFVITMSMRFMFALVLLLLTVWQLGYPVSELWLTLFYVLVCQLLLNLGVSYLFSSVTPIIPDISYLLPTISMGLMFTSGIFFDINERPEDIQAILRLNPYVEVVEGYRRVLLYGEAAHPIQFMYAWGFGIACLVAGAVVLKKLDRYYPRWLT